MGEPLYRVERDERGWIVHVSDDVGEEELAEVLDSLAACVIRKRSRSEGRRQSRDAGSAR
jgi:hypothetical protein